MLNDTTVTSQEQVENKQKEIDQLTEENELLRSSNDRMNQQIEGNECLNFKYELLNLNDR